MKTHSVRRHALALAVLLALLPAATMARNAANGQAIAVSATAKATSKDGQAKAVNPGQMVVTASPVAIS